jgi:DNA-binding LacI/PurR family transcriptional regulator
LFIGNDAHAEIRMRHAGLEEAAKHAGDVTIESLSYEEMSYASTYRAVQEWLTDHARPTRFAFFRYGGDGGDFGLARGGAGGPARLCAGGL